MSWTNKQIAKIFPTFALKREIIQRRLERLEKFKPQRSFEAVMGDRLRSDFLVPKNSADSALQGSDKLRQHIRQLEYNNGFMSGPILRIVNNVVGQGIHFQSRVMADKNRNEPFPTITQKRADRFNFEAERGYRIWGRKADKRLISNIVEIQRIVQGALERDGEILIIGRSSEKKDRIIPYCLEVLEIDRLMTPVSEFKNPRMRNGILYDQEGVPEIYFILKRHPGETYPWGLQQGESWSGGLGTRPEDFEQIPAFNPNGTRKVLHLFNVVRPEQSRGYSRFAAGLKDFQDLERYREAEIYAALEDACLTGIVTTPQPEDFQQAYTDGNILSPSSEDHTQRYHEFAPGKWNYLAPGEEIKVHAPSRPNPKIDEFINHLLRGPANALDIPPEILSQNWKDMNYSNARTVLLQAYLSFRVRQRYLIDHFCAPVYENVLHGLVVKGHVQSEGFDRRKDDFLRHIWIPPGWAWVDPVKEAKGKEIELKENMETLTEIEASKGRDIDEHLELRAIELRKMKDLEEKYDIKFHQVSNQIPENPMAGQQTENQGSLRVVK